MTSASRPYSSSAACSRWMLPTDLAIFSRAHLDHAVVHPDPGQRLAAGGLGLGDLVLVVGEHQVRAAAVDLEVGAEDLLGHRRALDVPAGPALAPRRGPRGVLALLVLLPQREVARARRLSCGGVVALALLASPRRAVRELAVVGEALDLEVHVALGVVGVPASISALISVDDRADRLRRLRLVVGPAEPEARRCRRRSGRSSRRASSSLGTPGRLRGVVDLVVHVGDVLDQRDLVALVLEEPLQQGEDHERPGVARRARGRRPSGRRRRCRPCPGSRGSSGRSSPLSVSWMRIVAHGRGGYGLDQAGGGPPTAARPRSGRPARAACASSPGRRRAAPTAAGLGGEAGGHAAAGWPVAFQTPVGIDAAISISVRSALCPPTPARRPAAAWPPGSCSTS